MRRESRRTVSTLVTSNGEETRYPCESVARSAQGIPGSHRLDTATSRRRNRPQESRRLGTMGGRFSRPRWRQHFCNPLPRENSRSKATETNLVNISEKTLAYPQDTCILWIRLRNHV